MNKNANQLKAYYKHMILILYKAAFGFRRFFLWDYWYLKLFNRAIMRKPGRSIEREALNHILLRYYLRSRVKAAMMEMEAYDHIRNLIAGEDLRPGPVVLREDGKVYNAIRNKEEETGE